MILVFAIAISNFVYLFVRNFARNTLLMAVPEHYQIKYGIPTPKIMKESTDFMRSSRYITGFLQTFFAPIVITAYFRWNWRITTEEELHLTIMLAIQMLQSALMLLSIFGSCAGDTDKDPANGWEAFGRKIVGVTVAANLGLGLIYAIAYLVIVNSTEDLENSVLKIWFYVYCFIQLILVLAGIVILILQLCQNSKCCAPKENAEVKVASLAKRHSDSQSKKEDMTVSEKREEIELAEIEGRVSAFDSKHEGSAGG